MPATGYPKKWKVHDWELQLTLSNRNEIPMRRFFCQMDHTLGWCLHQHRGMSIRHWHCSQMFPEWLNHPEWLNQSPKPEVRRVVNWSMRTRSTDPITFDVPLWDVDHGRCWFSRCRFRWDRGRWININIHHLEVLSDIQSVASSSSLFRHITADRERSKKIIFEQL